MMVWNSSHGNGNHEAFQQAKKQGKGTKRSILFLHVTGEERLIGF